MFGVGVLSLRGRLFAWAPRARSDPRADPGGPKPRARPCPCPSCLRTATHTAGCGQAVFILKHKERMKSGGSINPPLFAVSCAAPSDPIIAAYGGTSDRNQPCISPLRLIAHKKLQNAIFTAVEKPSWFKFRPSPSCSPFHG